MGVDDGDLSFRGLFTPQPEYDYFRVDVPFEDTRDYSAANAWWLAESSLLVYNEPDSIRANFPAGYDLAFFAERSTHAFLAARDDHCIVAFRGTDDAEDVLTDLRIKLGEGDVHSGFERALDLVWTEVVDHLAGRRAWFCGHSLGAALATLAAVRHNATEALYTYGSPRVGNKAFAEAFDVPAWRFVNNNDAVAHLPPPKPYIHVGRLMHFDQEGRLHDEPDLWDRVQHMVLGHRDRAADTTRRWLSGDFSTRASAAIIDHAARLYAKRTLQQL